MILSSCCNENEDLVKEKYDLTELLNKDLRFVFNNDKIDSELDKKEEEEDIKNISNGVDLLESEDPSSENTHQSVDKMLNKGL